MTTGGKLIAIEGIDGSGKRTQVELLKGALGARGHQTFVMGFPIYDSWFGKMVGKFLDGGFGPLEEVDPHFTALLYAGDRFEAKGQIVEALAAGKVVLSDRYVGSNMAHQTARVAAAERAEFVKWIEHLEYQIYGLPRESAVIYLRVPPTEAQKLVALKSTRAYTASIHDLLEENLRHLEDAAGMYDELAKRANWISVECFDSGAQAMRAPPAIAAEILTAVEAVLTAKHGGESVVMGFSEFVGNERIVNALRGALRAERVPHALLFTGASGVGKYTLARMFAQAATCERMKDDFCGECDTCKRVVLLADPASLVQQGLAERGESADAAMVERTPLILQTHPDVWAVVPDPVRLKTPVVRPMLRVGQIRAVQRAAYFQPMGRRRVFILDGADTMRWDVANVFLKILEEPPPSATLILIAPSPYSLLPTIVSRCMQFHFAPLPQADVEHILKEKTDRKCAEITLAAQFAEGSPGLAMEMDVEMTAQRRKDALRILTRAAQGQGFAQLFADTAAMAKDRETTFERQLGIFYGLLTDLLELSAKIKNPMLRNKPLAKELEALSKTVDVAWVMRAIAGFDELHAGARRNLNRQLGLDALAASLAMNG